MRTTTGLLHVIIAAMSLYAGAAGISDPWRTPPRNPANGPNGKLHPTYPSACDGRPDAAARPAAGWLSGAVMYQLFTRMFTPEGTFRAAAAKLPELKDLGVTVIYLTPHQLADDDPDRANWSARQKECGLDNAKNPYRQKDINAVDPEYGDAEDLKAFVAEAHRLGIRVLFDLVYFHCGPRAVFLGEHADWIVRNPDGTPALGGWAFPQLDFANAGLREYLWANMVSLVRDYDVDGFRCDVADMLPVAFWEEGYRRAKTVKDDIVLMCEGLKGDDQIKAFDLSYGFYVQWTLVDCLSGNARACALEAAWRAERRDFPKGFHWMRCFENHDLANVLPGGKRKEDKYGRDLNAAMLATCFLLDGVPMLYNGQEIADSAPHSIFSNRSHGGLHIDWSRADDTAARERRALVRRLSALRHENPALFDAPVVWNHTDDPDNVYSFTRPLTGGKSITLTVDLKARRFEIAEKAGASSVTFHESHSAGETLRWFEEMVPMPGGERLYTYGAAPPPGVRCGIVVLRTPYVAEKRVDMLAYARDSRAAMERGYVYVRQHCRGCGMSEGDWVPYENERADGLALLDWVRRLPFYGGEIFLHGGSYLSSVHWSYLDTNPPDVKGALLGVQNTDRYDVVYRNGFFKAALHGDWFVKGYKKKNKALQRNSAATFADFPLCDFPRRYWGEEVPSLANVIAHPRRDDPFWSSDAPGSGANYRQAFDKSTMPILLRTGFYDIYTEAILDMWRSAPAERRANCALLVNSCNHSGQASGSLAKTLAVFPGGTRADEGVDALDWFDYCRTGTPLTNAAPGRTRYYALWENRWLEAAELTDGPRRVELPLGEGTRTWTYDPKRPLPDFPGSGGICFGGMQVQPPPGFRDDVVSFLLPALVERLDVRGRMTARLSVTSDCEDTGLYVRVSVDKGDGQWLLLRDDITSLNWRAHDRYIPGSVREVEFRFADHAFRLEPGDRLRVDVASACSQFAPHGNLAGSQFAVREPKTARNTVDAARSCIVLPSAR